MTNYKGYMASDEWKRKRTHIRRRARGWCERCKVGRRADVHHLTYERLGQELDTDLIAVCKECHEFLHGKRTRDPALHDFTKEDIQALRRIRKRQELNWQLNSFARPPFEFLYPTLHDYVLDQTRQWSVGDRIE